jgi:hypothetical protein
MRPSSCLVNLVLCYYLSLVALQVSRRFITLEESHVLTNFEWMPRKRKTVQAVTAQPAMVDS